MEENSRFDFCPKCGAVSKDGICQSCGYQNTDTIKQVQYQQSQYQQTQHQQPQYQSSQTWSPQMYQPCAVVPPAKPKPKKAVVVVYFICLAIVIVGLVFVILAAVSDMESKDSERGGRNSRTDTVQQTQEADDEIKEAGSEDPEKPNITYFHRTLDVTDQNWNEEGQDPLLPYYSGPYNALRDDLSYELSFMQDIYSADSANVFLAVEYPQIAAGDLLNRDYINRALHYDYDYFHNLFTEEFRPLMEDNSTFHIEVNSHVTYMDEKILSVVFVENVYLDLGNDPFTMINYFCMNFDLETGILLEDTELLRLDEEFAVDFRRREAEENGEEALTNYSDQEILDMLKDTSCLVVFYTPMGMEVGLNLGQRVVYVTYADYERFLNTF